MPALSTLVVCAAIGLASVLLEGCFGGGHRGPPPTDQCLGYAFNESGLISTAWPGDIVRVTCPEDTVYVGPDIACSWVDRFCMGYSYDYVDEDYCWRQYNFTLRGQGLTSWPEGVRPRMVSPQMPLAPDDAVSDVDANAAKERRRSLPTIVSPTNLLCVDQPYADLDFEHAEVIQSNLGGWGPDTGSTTLRFRGITAVGEGRKVDLVISSDDGYVAGDAEKNGLAAGVMGKVNVGDSRSFKLTFSFVDSVTDKPVTLSKFFFTLVNLGSYEDHDIDEEITVDGISQYFVSKDADISVDVRGGGRYVFSTYTMTDLYGSQFQMETLKDDKRSVTEMHQEALDRSVALVFKEKSEFSLKLKLVVGASSRDVQFAGWTELAKVGRKVKC